MAMKVSTKQETQPEMMVMSRFKSIQHNMTSSVDTMSIPELLGRFEGKNHMEIGDKAATPCMSFARFTEGKPRKDENVEEVTAIVLDCDVPMTTEQVEAMRKRITKAGIIYSTYSSEPDAYKLRVILPLETAIPGAEYMKSGVSVLAAKMLGVAIDSTCRSPSHIYYVPSCPPGRGLDHFIWTNEDSCQPWELSDFPAPEEDDMKKYINSSPRSGQNAPATEQPAKEQEDYKIIDGIIKDFFDGHNPIFVEGKILIFTGQRWLPVDKNKLRKLLIVDYFKRTLTPSKVDSLIATMAALYSQESFPMRAAPDGNGESVPVSLNTIVCCLNSTLDISTGEIVPDDPDYYLRMQFQFDYDPEARCDRWLQFLDEVFAFDDDKEQKIALLQEYIGLSLIYCTKSYPYTQVMLHKLNAYVPLLGRSLGASRSPARGS